MINTISGLIKNHFSFLILTISSLSLFLVNIFFKYKLTDQEYSKFGLLISIIGFIVVFGFLGIEQTFLRISKTYKKEISISKRNLQEIFFASSVFIIVASFICIHTYKFDNIFSIFLIVSLQVTTFLYLILRLQHKWNISQIYGNGWKIFFFISILILYIFNVEISLVLIEKVLLVIFIIFLIMGIYKISQIKFNLLEFDHLEIRKLNINFFISILLISILSFADRFIIESKLGSEEFSIYFYYLSIIFYPFSLLQGYIGFKELPVFKKEFNEDIFFRKIKKILVLSLITTLLIIILILIFNNLNIKTLQIKDFLLVSLFICLGIVKLFYSLLSAAIGAHAKAKNIMTINLKSIIFILLILFIILSLKIINIYTIAFVFVLFWFFRSVFMYIEIKKYIK